MKSLAITQSVKTLLIEVGMMVVVLLLPDSELLLRKESHLLPVRSHTHRSGVLCISWYRLLPSDNLSSSGAGPSKSSHSGNI